MKNEPFVVSPRKPAVGKSSVVSVRLPDDTLEQLEAIAGRTGRTRNELIQMCINYALENLVIEE